MPLDQWIFACLFSMLAGISAIALYSELHRKRFEPRPTADHIFRCEKCAFVYTDDADVDRSRCPQCGVVNDSIEF